MAGFDKQQLVAAANLMHDSIERKDTNEKWSLEVPLRQPQHIDTSIMEELGPLFVSLATMVWDTSIYGSDAGVTLQLTSAVSPCWIASTLVQLSNVGNMIGEMPPERELFRNKVL